MIEPFILEERQLNVSPLSIYSRLLMDRIIFIGDEINHELANVVQAQMLYLASLDSNAPIELYINSPGGSVQDGLLIYDTMNLVSCPIHTICTGNACSMAAILLCAGDVRKALPHSRIMIHQPSGGVSGVSSDIEIATELIKLLKKELFEILSKHTKKDFKEIEKICDRDKWFTAKEALDYNLIDKIL